MSVSTLLAAASYIVDDVVGDRVQHLGGSDGQAFGIGLELVADAGEIAALTVADGDHEVDADEDHAPHRARTPPRGRRSGAVFTTMKQRVVVPLELRALMRVDGVLDGQRVQLVELGDVLQLVLARLGHADPREAPRSGAGRVASVVWCVDAVEPASVLVHRDVDDHLASVARKS